MSVPRQENDERGALEQQEKEAEDKSTQRGWAGADTKNGSLGAFLCGNGEAAGGGC